MRNTLVWIVRGGALIILLLVVAILAIRTPWAQQYITDKAAEFVSEKTQTVFSIQKLFITFRGDMKLEGVYLEDQNQDTLVHIGSLEAGVAFAPLIDGNINISRVNWNGLEANVHRKQDSTFNFTFLIDAFSGEPKAKDTTTAELPNIAVGPIHFSAFNLHYKDELIGLDAKLHVGDLTLQTDDVNLNTLRFEVDELAFSDVSGRAIQWMSIPPSEDGSTTSILPFISVNELSLKNINLEYASAPEKLNAGINLGELNLTNAELDLNSQNILLDELYLKNTNVFAKLPESEPKATTASPPHFVWPSWKISANKLELVDDLVELQIGETVVEKGKLNPSHLRIAELNLTVENILLDKGNASLKMKSLSLRERSGFSLQQVGFDLSVSERKALFTNFELRTPNNLIRTDLKLNFAAIDSLIQHPLASYIELDLAQTNLSILDAYFFAPQLKLDTFIQSISTYPLYVKGVVSGAMEDLTISGLEIRALNSLRLTLDGTLKGLPDTNALRLNIPNLNLSLSKKDLAVFVKKEEQLTTLPNQMQLRAKLSGGVKKLLADFALNTDLGNVELTAEAADLLEIPSARGNLITLELNAAKLASVPELNPISAQVDFNATGNSLETLVADVSLNFQQLIFQEYDYSGLKLKANAANQTATVTINHHDENLDFALLAEAILDTLNPSANLNIDLTGINLEALGLSAQSVKMGGQITAAYSGLPSNFESSVDVSEGIVVKGSEVYRMQPISVALRNSVSATKLNVKSEILNGYLEANTSIDSVVGAITAYAKRLTSADSLRAGVMNDSLDVAAHFSINNSRGLTSALLPELTRLDSIKLDLEFHPSQDNFDLTLSIPKVIYANYDLDSLGVNASGTAQNMKGALAFRELKGGPIHINRTRVDAAFADKVATVQLTVNDSLEEKLAAIGVDIDVSTKKTLLHFLPDGLILNGTSWSIPAQNQIAISDSGIVYKSIDLSQSAQHLKVENLKSGKPNGMKVSFDGFELSSLTTILNANDSLLGGALNGTVRLVNLNTKPGIEADVKLNQLTVLGMELGQMKLLANNKEVDKYSVDLSIKGTPIDLSVKGNLLAKEEPELDLQLDLARLNMNLIDGFVGSYIRKTGGSLEARSSVSGPISDLKYNGYLAFNQATLNVTEVNSQFTLPNDRIDVSNAGLLFKSFDLLDANGKKITVDGKVDTKTILDPKFDLKITANNFQPFNSTRDDSELFYGKAFVDLDVTVKGSLSLPKVKARAKLRKGTDVTFIVPESQAAIEERKGLVRFANMKDTLSMILIPEKVEEISLFKGINLIGYLEIDRATKFQIVIDERSGDKLDIEGEAKLNLEITPNGIMTLSGNYEVESGGYQLNFYGLAKRKFELVSGSRIVWSGDPLAGQLDLAARYSLKTSASDLMADQLAQSDVSTQNKYRQALPFEVMLNIGGELLSPEISFGIDMPESGRQALDGNVYKRVRQLNSTQSELEKQVFSLIVLNRFLPQSFDQSDGSGSESFARSSVSKLLSGQLNKYSEKYLKGVELNFDLNSYTDYQSGAAQDKTQLDLNIRKALFNERLVVQVGGQVDIEGQNKSYGADDIIGDISIEYLLTKEGQYRLKGFRKNEFQDLLQGQVVVSGLSVLFSKSFDEWKGLFKKAEKPISEEVEQKEEETK